MIFPLMEESSITPNNFDIYVSTVRELCNCYKLVTICLESLLDCKTLSRFIDEVNVDNLKCVFDTGNRSSSKNPLMILFWEIDWSCSSKG